jgi:hypothetical protein
MVDDDDNDDDDDNNNNNNNLWCSALLEKLTLSHPIKKFDGFYKPAAHNLDKINPLHTLALT